MAFKLDYYNITHTGLSYSRQLTLHACPKKYELDAKKAIKANRSSVTFSYGHAVAAGIQYAIAGESFNRCIVETVLAYTHDEEDIGSESEQRAKKSIWHSILAVKEFYNKYKAGLYGFLDGWEIARFINPDTGEEMNAIELTFVVKLIEDYSFEGHIDLILWHPVKQKFMVIELKTTGMSTINEASYKNSAQALGYGAILDLMAANLDMSASFDVLYLVLQSKTRQLVPMPFTKTAKDRVDWLTNLIIDVKQIQMYEQLGYPKRGESCFDFFRPCEYIGTCSMSDNAIATMYGSATGKTEEESYTKLETPTFIFELEELMERQELLIEQIKEGKVSDNADAELLLTTLDVE